MKQKGKFLQMLRMKELRLRDTHINLIQDWIIRLSNMMLLKNTILEKNKEMNMTKWEMKCKKTLKKKTN
jgi:hypothetical protein